MNHPRPFILSETNWKTIKETNYEVAILPWGATEAHNYHLPYTTDVIQAVSVSERAAEIAWKAGAKIMVLPCVPFGVNGPQIDVKFNINMNPTTQHMVLKDIVEALEIQGIKKLIIVNGHGGNNFSPMIKELSYKHNVFICVFDWFNILDEAAFFNEPGDHAGEMETSVMLHVVPHLVMPIELAGNGKMKKLNIKSLNEGWAWAQRGWLGVTTNDTGAGNPALASADKGKKYVDAVVEKVSQLFIEVAAADLNNLYTD